MKSLLKLMYFLKNRRANLKIFLINKREYSLEDAGNDPVRALPFEPIPQLHIVVVHDITRLVTSCNKKEF